MRCINSRTLLFTLTLQQSHTVHKKNHGVGFDSASVFILSVMTSPALKNRAHWRQMLLAGTIHKTKI